MERRRRDALPGVIPGRAEACEYRSLPVKEFVHLHEHGDGIRKMFKGIEGHNCICFLIRMGAKETDFLHSLPPGLCACLLEQGFSNIDSNHSEGAVLR